MYHQNYYKSFGKDLSKQKITNFPRELNFVGKLEKDDDARMFFYCWKMPQKFSKLFFLDSLIVKLLNLLIEPNNSKFVARKLNTVNDHSNTTYDAGNEIIYNTEVLKSNLCD